MTALEHRVDELARRHSGRDFAEAIRAYSATLDEEAQEELKQVLLGRARLLEDAVEERLRARGWMRRTFNLLEEAGREDRSPPSNRRQR